MNDYLQVLVWVVTLAIAGYAIYAATRNGQTVTLPGVVQAVKTAEPIAVEISRVAGIAVQAAEQLGKTGKLPDNDAKFEYALDYIKKNIPYTAGVSNKDIETAIESAVFLVNNTVKNYSATVSEPGVIVTNGSSAGVAQP